MHYGSVVAVYCLALRGVGSRCVSQPVRHLKAEKKNHLHQPCCRTLRWWQKRLISVFMYSRGGCGVSAFQPRLCLPSKISFSPLPPSLPPRTGSRAFTEVNVLMSETDWYCSAVRRGVDAVFMCMNDCVCVHGWCSGLAELQQWLSPSEPNLAPVCWWALLTFCPHWLLWSVELTISPGQTERRCWSVSLLASKTFSVSRWEHIKLFLHLFWVSEGLQLIVFWRRFNWQSFVWSIN